jgi:hypothetical protein
MKESGQLVGLVYRAAQLLVEQTEEKVLTNRAAARQDWFPY